MGKELIKVHNKDEMLDTNKLGDATAQLFINDTLVDIEMELGLTTNQYEPTIYFNFKGSEHLNRSASISWDAMIHMFLLEIMDENDIEMCHGGLYE